MFAIRLALLSLLILAALGACGSDDPEKSVDGGTADSGSEAPGGGQSADGGQRADGGQPVDGGRPADAGDGAAPVGNSTTFGEPYEGGEFHLGPVDWAETEWHNACAPAGGYLPAIRQVEGELLAGLWNGIPNVAQYCDACIKVTTARGKSALLRVVTYGDTTTNSIDVSPAAMQLLDSGEYPRTMSWQLAACPQTGKIMYEVQTGSSEWWTSLWVRNARLPLSKVEVKSVNHSEFLELERGGDGTLTDASGFGKGQFTLRLTALDGTQYEDTFAWPAGGIAGQLLTGHGNFP